MTDKNKKLLVIGLDCAAPQLVFDDFLDYLPNIKSLLATGAYAKLRSCDPPITVPAWTVMTSSKNPGRLGFYGFRNRAGYVYGKMAYADATAVREDRVWDILSRHDRKVVILGVPQTYPPSWVNGSLVGCFLSPGTDSNYTFPAVLKDEILEVTGGYVIDVKDFRTDDKAGLLRRIHDMTHRRFALAKHFLANKPWDFFMMVEMGVDRIHHAFWKYMDKEHPKYKPGSEFQNSIRDYYIMIDKHIGEMLSLIDRENTSVMIVSDHGAKKMTGGLAINEWLISKGYLALKSKPEGNVPLEKCEIDWDKTTAWGAGGYYGRLFMNVRGREPQGIIEPGGYEHTRDKIAAEIEAINDHNGRPMGNSALKPQDLYPECNGTPPDLFIYFGDLDWRSVGTVGSGEIYSFENDTGPDDANHDYHGIIIMNGPDVPHTGKMENLDIIDCAPTMLKLLGEKIPSDMEGKPVI